VIKKKFPIFIKKTKKSTPSIKKQKARIQSKKKKSAPQARVAYKEHSLDT
jgi:hypothetical protein